MTVQDVLNAAETEEKNTSKSWKRMWSRKAREEHPTGLPVATFYVL